jgi:hypothetical protein
MAGLAAEGLEYDKVVGQSAYLFSLQVLYNFFFRSSPVLFSHFRCDYLRAMHLKNFFYLFLEVHKQDKSLHSAKTSNKTLLDGQ